MTISIIIPTYNRAEDCARAVESCISQLGEYDEIVVVDDGSSDNTLEVLQSYVDRLPGIVRVFSQENAGVGVARNTAIREAVGEYIVLLDSDDILLPWTIDRVRSAIDRFDEPTIIAGPTPFFEDPSEIDTSTVPDPGARYYRDLLGCWKSPPYMPGSGIAVRRDALDGIGGFFPHRHLGEDIDLYLRLAERPGFVLYDSPIYAQYRPRSCAHTGISQNPQSVYKSCQYLLKHLSLGDYGPITERTKARQAWVTATTRPSSLYLAKHGFPELAMRVYSRTLAMNLSLGRFRYLAGLPLMVAQGKFRGPPLERDRSEDSAKGVNDQAAAPRKAA